MVDIFCILIGVLVMFIWRVLFLVKLVKKLKYDGKKWNRWRFEVFLEFIFIFIDFVCLIFFIVIIIIWRVFFLINEFNYVKKI